MVRLEGLSQEEVAKKIQEGKQNKVTIKTEKSIGQIIRDNVFTYFNLIFLVLAVLLVAVKSWNNLLFVPVVVVNSLVGIVQEVRSRRILRQMQFLHMSEAIVLREGKDLTIVANGLCVAASLEAAEKLAADGIDAKVINIHTIKPLDEDLIVAAAKETGKVVTVEEHSVIGGLGGAVCECLSEKAPVPVKRIGVNDVFGESGPAVALLEKYGLDAEGIYKQIKEFV